MSALVSTSPGAWCIETSPIRRNRFDLGLMLLAFALLASLACLGGTEAMDFRRDIQPILSNHCFPCHGPDAAERKANLRLDRLDDLDGLPEGILIPEHPESSAIIDRVLSQDPAERMPPPDAHLELNSQQKKQLTQWVLEGAQWQPHWSFIPPSRPPLPEVHHADWVHNPIDAFVLHLLELQGLTPSPRAEPHTLARRLSLALTGLALDWDRLQEEDAGHPRRYEDWVEHCLASPHYGEAMALPWLDAARYADTHGYQNDGEREMWPWRDWVIHAFNQNMPYDQFTIEQLAGDLLPLPEVDQIIATGFNRNHRYNSEGGSIPQEVTTENVADRVETTCATWMGVTMQCARCHDHKYDPFSMEEYYGLFAIFHNITESGRAIRDGNSEPYIKAPNWHQQETLRTLHKAREEAQQRLDALHPSIERDLVAFSRWHQQDTSQLSWMQDGLIHQRSFEGHLQGVDTRTTEDQDPMPLPRWGKGIRGQGAVLDGRWKGSLGDIGRFTNQTPYTISMWFHPDSTKGGAIFSRIEDGVGGKGYQLTYDAGHFAYLFISQGYAGRMGIESLEPFTEKRWYHLTVTYDASMSARGLGLFIDGEPAACRITQNNDSNPGAVSGQPFRIGASSMAEHLFGMLDELLIFDRVLNPREIHWLSEPSSLGTILSLDSTQRSPRQKEIARALYLQNVSHGPVHQAVKGLAQAQSRLQAFVDDLPTVMIMQERDSPRPTHLLERGQYDRPLALVEPSLPKSIHPSKTDSKIDRLDLAHWLVDPHHPLTARVQVNRLWQQMFGKGLVSTSEDFGIQGEPPSHPELLDWLAVEFIESGWDIKHMLRLIAQSATYQQSSASSTHQRERDPENQWMGRGPSVRLHAFHIRDLWLQASAMLVTRSGGPPVYPYQPKDLWSELSRKTYPQSSGPDLYRRSIYTYFKRTINPPLMATFDASQRESCILKKETTNTPLQALALFNAPEVMEAAKALAQKSHSQHPHAPEGQIHYLFRHILLRDPSQKEIEGLLASYSSYQTMPQATSKDLGVTVSNDPVEASTFPAFCTALCLFGLHETLSPR